ncbi:MAG: hypothetical protein V7L14_04710 [Nostoc sp.]|uniref:hypothetical protein n=1 Tax=Nostoc sp. TaxID=1180 RepID=UPI002FFC3703
MLEAGAVLFCAIAVGDGGGVRSGFWERPMTTETVYMNNRPKKKTQLFKSGQIEGYEVGLTLEEFPCPLCDGSGEINDDDADGVPYREECSDYDGEGVLYISID